MGQRILTLNVRHGGGKRVDTLLGKVQELVPDTIVLSEFRHGGSGTRFQDGLKGLGFPHQMASDIPVRTNGVLVASRHPITVADPGTGSWLEDRHMVMRTNGLNLVAVYLPTGPVKLPSWERLFQTAMRLKDEPTVLIGDFNTGKHWIDEAGATFIGPEYIDRLESLGYADAWRSMHPDGREYTWYSSKGNGFRLDYLFASSAIATRILNAEHIHATRAHMHSDHSGLLVTLTEDRSSGILTSIE